METKPWWASKTLLVNLVALGAAVAAGHGFDLGITTEVQAHLVAGLLATANIVLRLTTKKAVTLT